MARRLLGGEESPWAGGALARELLIIATHWGDFGRAS